MAGRRLDRNHNDWRSRFIRKAPRTVATERKGYSAMKHCRVNCPVILWISHKSQETSSSSAQPRMVMEVKGRILVAWSHGQTAEKLLAATQHNTE